MSAYIGLVVGVKGWTTKVADVARDRRIRSAEWGAHLDVTVERSIDAAHLTALFCDSVLHGGHLALQLCHAFPLQPNLKCTHSS